MEDIKVAEIVLGVLLSSSTLLHAQLPSDYARRLAQECEARGMVANFMTRSCVPSPEQRQQQRLQQQLDELSRELQRQRNQSYYCYRSGANIVCSPN